MNNEHKLVKDLFPNYIEKLTSDETNKFIEEHIASCEKCRQSLEKMKSEMIEENHTNLSDKKINFAKKVNKKLKLFQLFALLFAIIIIILVSNYFRKVLILNKLKNLDCKYESSNDFIIAQNFNNEDDKYVTTYYKNGKYLIVDESFSRYNLDNNLFKKTIKQKKYYIDEKYYDFYYNPIDSTKIDEVQIEDIKNETELTINSKPETFKSYSEKYTNFDNVFITALKVKISTKKFDGIDCYKIDSYGINTLNLDYSDTYFEKNTGLLRKTGSTEYNYYFDIVNDNVFKIPEIPEETNTIINGSEVTGGDIYE